MNAVDRKPSFKLSIAAPYPEGAAIEYARRCSESGRLVELLVPSRALSHLAVRTLGRRRSGLLRARLLRGIEGVPQTRAVAPALEALRLLSRHPKLRALAPWAVDLFKSSFDRTASRHLTPTDVVLGLPGACEQTFRRSTGRVKVFHAVDGHPRALNALLRTTFGEQAHREMYSDIAVARIERELDLADLVLVPSLLKSRQMEEWGVRSERLRVVPYGVDPDRFTSDVGPRSAGDPRLLFVGQMSYRKGVPSLIAAARGQAVELTLIGPIVQPEILERLPPNVTYVPTVSPAELNTYFHGSDALVLPSLEDAFGLVVAEALAAGLPVITTTQTGASEIVGEGDGWIVDAGDPSALRVALRSVPPLSSVERSARGARFRKERSGQTWAAYAAGVDEAIDDVIRSRRKERT